jgi:hypothetical protein
VRQQDPASPAPDPRGIKRPQSTGRFPERCPSATVCGWLVPQDRVPASPRGLQLRIAGRETRRRSADPFERWRRPGLAQARDRPPQVSGLPRPSDRDTPALRPALSSRLAVFSPRPAGTMTVPAIRFRVPGLAARETRRLPDGPDQGLQMPRPIQPARRGVRRRSREDVEPATAASSD